MPYALRTLVWRSDRFGTFRTCASIGREHLVYRWKDTSLWPNNAAFCLVYRQLGWVPPTCRVGEAKTPGPHICCVNLGGWSRVDPTLLLAHDIVAVQETFVRREHLSSAKHQAAQL
eukprot:1447239-Amphidinium_carterae.1